MVADFNILKLGFANWLQTKDTDDNSSSAANISGSDASIYLNSKEFKEYLSEELNIDFSSLNMSINDILNMEIVNGQLTLPENSKTAADKTDLTGDAFIVNTDETNIGEQEILISGILNDLLSEDTIKSLIDTDSNSEISNDEINIFMNAISILDGDKSDISLDDIFGAIEGIKNNTFSLTPDNTTEIPQEQAVQAEQSVPESTSGSNNTGGSYSPGSTYNPGNNTNTAAEETNKNPLEGMSLEELNEELSKTQGGLAEKKETLNNALTGSTPELQALKGQEEEAYKAYKEQLSLVNEEMAEKLDDIESRLTDAEDNLKAKEQEIWEQEGVVNDSKTAYDNAVSKRENLQSLVSSLENTDTSKMSAEDKAAFETKLSNARTQLEAAKEEEKNTEKALQDAQDKLETLNSDYESLETVLGDIQQEKTDFEAEIKEQYPQIQEYMDAYNKAKTDYTTEKNNAIDKARTAVNDSETYINALKTEITKTENEEDKKEFSAGPESLYNEEAGAKLAQAALNTRGTTGWCLAGVNDTLAKVYGQRLSFNSAYQAAAALKGEVSGYEELASKFVEVEVPEDKLVNLPAGAIIVWDKGGNSSVSSLGQEHGHISIALGDGRESSDHIQNQTTNRGTDYWVFYPVE